MCMSSACNVLLHVVILMGGDRHVLALVGFSCTKFVLLSTMICALLRLMRAFHVYMVCAFLYVVCARLEGDYDFAFVPARCVTIELGVFT